LLTYCPRCKRALSIDEYDALDRCPSCSHNLNITHYTVAILMALLFGGVPWLFAFKLASKDVNLLWGFSFGMITFAGAKIGGDLILLTRGMRKPVRRMVVGWTSLIFGIAAGIAAWSISAPF
jgi:hypothetical protein